MDTDEQHSRFAGETRVLHGGGLGEVEDRGQVQGVGSVANASPGTGSARTLSRLTPFRASCRLRKYALTGPMPFAGCGDEPLVLTEMPALLRSRARRDETVKDQVRAGPLARWGLQGAPQFRRPVPPAGGHTGTGGRLHPVRAGHGEDPRCTGRVGWPCTARTGPLVRAGVRGVGSSDVSLGVSGVVGWRGRPGCGRRQWRRGLRRASPWPDSTRQAAKAVATAGALRRTSGVARSGPHQVTTPFNTVLGSCSCASGEGSEPSCCCASEGMVEPRVELWPYVEAGFEIGRTSPLAVRLDARVSACPCLRACPLPWASSWRRPVSPSSRRQSAQRMK